MGQVGSMAGKLFGIPKYTDTIGVFYNKDLLAQAGVTPPTTWDELRAAAQQLTAGQQITIGQNASEYSDPVDAQDTLTRVVSWGDGCGARCSSNERQITYVAGATKSVSSVSETKSQVAKRSRARACATSRSTLCSTRFSASRGWSTLTARTRCRSRRG